MGQEGRVYLSSQEWPDEYSLTSILSDSGYYTNILDDLGSWYWNFAMGGISLTKIEAVLLSKRPMPKRRYVYAEIRDSEGKVAGLRRVLLKDHESGAHTSPASDTPPAERTSPTELSALRHQLSAQKNPQHTTHDSQPTSPISDTPPAGHSSPAGRSASIRHLGYQNLFRHVVSDPYNITLLKTSNLNPLVFLMDDHSGSYKAWEISRLIGRLPKPGILIRLDYHDDLRSVYGGMIPQPGTIQDALDTEYTCINFTIPAVYYGLIDEIYLIGQGPERENGYTYEAVLYKASCKNLPAGVAILQNIIKQKGGQPTEIIGLTLPKNRNWKAALLKSNDYENIKAIKRIKVHIVESPESMPDLSKDDRPILWDTDMDYYSLEAQGPAYHNDPNPQKRLKLTRQYLRKINRTPDVFTFAVSRGLTGEFIKTPFMWLFPEWIDIVKNTGVGFEEAIFDKIPFAIAMADIHALSTSPANTSPTSDTPISDSVQRNLRVLVSLTELILADCRKVERQTPYVVAIGGPAGTGKSTYISDSLKKVLEKEGKKVLVLNMDSFFLKPDERSTEDPGAEWDAGWIRRAKMEEFMERFRQDEKAIPVSNYDRDYYAAHGEYKEEVVDLDGVDIVLFEGVFTLSDDAYLGNPIEFADFPIYVHTGRENIEKWKRLQESRKAKPRSTERLNRLIKDEHKVTDAYIEPSKKNAFAVLHLDANHDITMTLAGGQNSAPSALRMQREIKELQEQLEIAKREARTDELTGLYNKRALTEYLSREISYARRHGTQLSVIVIDVDHFKQFNDTHGHQAGDRALIHLADIIRKSARTEDNTFRYGGEEFTIVARQAPEGMKELAERIRKAVENTPFEGKSITISLGVSTLRPGDSLTSLIERADRALYLAKDSGRNRVTTELENDGKVSAKHSSPAALDLRAPIKDAIQELGAEVADHETDLTGA